MASSTTATSIGKVIGATTDGHGNRANERPARDTSYGNNTYSDHHQALVVEEKPSRVEIWGWNLYGFCTYFIQTTLIPVVFPLIISQVADSPSEPPQGWGKSHRGLSCRPKELKLFEALAHGSVGHSGVSPLEWTSVSWVIGLVFAAPTLSFISIYLDYGQNQNLVAGAATVLGALFCLPAGFFKTPWIFLPYIIAIVIANAVATACHTRNLGLMIRGFTGPAVQKRQFLVRRSVSGWLSLYGTAAGCFGAALISAFAYHMLEQKEEFISLWVVSIFSGLAWLLGILHVITTYRPGLDSSPPSNAYVLSLFNYPHAIGSLVSVFLASFATMCIFTGGVLYLMGELCLRPVVVLFFLLTYFLFPILSLPLLHPLQNLIKANAVKMKLLGFLLTMLTAAVGFYFRRKNWSKGHVLFFAAIQSTAAGILYAFGRVLLLDCTPPGKEGAFSAWYSWVRALGTCAGFAIASVAPGSVSTSFGVGFICALMGSVMLVFGNISDLSGAKAAGNLKEDGELGSPMGAVDRSMVTKQSVRVDGP